MATYWHLSRQQKSDRPIQTADLRRLAAEGLISPTDRVRKSGSRRWLSASEVAGLFDADKKEWYYIRDRETFGPFNFAELWQAARTGKLLPDDQVWRPGMGRWKRAAKFSGMFPGHKRSGPRLDQPSVYSQKFHSIRRLRSHLLAQRADLPFLWLAGACLVLLVALMAAVFYPVRPATAERPASAPSLSMASGADDASERPSPHPEPPPVEVTKTPESPGPARAMASEAASTPAPEVAPQTAPAPSPSRAEGRPLTTEEERHVGRLIHRLIVANHKVVGAADGALQRRLRLAAEPLVSHRRNKDVEPTFTILDTDEILAISHPGEYVYVSKGLFNLVKNDVELQFVVAIEFAHLSMRHLERNAAALEVGLLRDRPRPFYRQIAVGYKDEQVYEADARAFRQLGRLGHPAYRMLLLLSPESHSYGEADPRGSLRRPTTPPGAGRQEIENHWRANPPAAERFRRLNELAEAPTGPIASGA